MFVKEIFGELQKSFIPIKETFEFQWRISDSYRRIISPYKKPLSFKRRFKIILEYVFPFPKRTPLKGRKRRE